MASATNSSRLGRRLVSTEKSGRPNFLVAAIKVLSERLPAVAANISGYYQVSGGVKRWGKGLPLPVNETALMEVLVKAGPVSIG